MTTSAPYARSSAIFSWLILSGITKMQRYPLIAAAIARPTPVFPEVGSTIVPPGRSFPSRSAASIIPRPMRSLTEPPGLRNSSFARMRAPCVGGRRSSRTIGVPPTRSRMVGYSRAIRREGYSSGSAAAREQREHDDPERRADDRGHRWAALRDPQRRVGEDPGDAERERDDSCHERPCPGL